MTSDRSVALDGEASAWSRFWFTPRPLTGLSTVRVLAGVLFCAWLLSFIGHERAFFSLNGWADKQLLIEAQQKSIPMAPLGWSILYLAETPEAFQAIYFGSILVLLLFTLGVATRLTAALSWVVVVSFLANPAISYEADFMLGILAFYLMLAYACVGFFSDNLSLAERILGSRQDLLFGASFFGPPAREERVSYAANGFMRLMQIHFAIIIVTSGLHKLQIGYWWSGVALWFPLHPPFQTTEATLLAERGSALRTIFILSLLQYLVLAWQIVFPAFAWRTGYWRVLLLGGAALGWLGVFFVFKLPLFGPFVMICALCYLTPAEWARLAALGRGVVGESAAAKSATAEAKKPMVVGSSEHIKKA